MMPYGKRLEWSLKMLSVTSWTGADPVDTNPILGHLIYVQMVLWLFLQNHYNMLPQKVGELIFLGLLEQ